ncbi:MAG TPA: hypothetical protein PKH33_18495 [bacterium]|nr:hypothetical protein [bacterium]
MLDEPGHGLEGVFIAGGIYLLADYLERKERECLEKSPEYAAVEAETLKWGCATIIVIISSILLLIVFATLFLA